MTQKPKGEITIQTLAMPSDTNANGDIFGGWLVSQMDLAAGILAKRTCHARAVTVAINSMSFLKPVNVGDVVRCYARILKVGNTSMTIAVEAWREGVTTGDIEPVTEGTFVFVGIGEDHKPVRVTKND